MAEAASRQNFTFVDLNNIFDSVTEKVFTDYCHLTPKGNEQIAEKLLTSIEPSLIPELINKTRAAE
jgi:lysophospholipase L1-like esterase